MTKNNFHKVLTIGPSNKGGMYSVIQGYKTFFSPFYFIKASSDGSILKKIALLLCVFFKIPYYVFFKKISIIHIHVASGKSFIRKSFIIRYCSLFRVNIIFHLHGGRFHLFAQEYGIEKIKKILFKCDRIVVLSKEWETFINDTLGYKETRIINNIVPFPQKKNTKNANSKIRFLYLGTIDEWKGIFDLLEVLSLNKESYSQKLELIIGGNGETERLNSYIKEKQLDSMVQYVGWVDGAKKIELLNNSDVYILPSYNEGLPISILEAMSYGKPIISTPVGGIPNIVKHTQNGFLVTPGNLVELKESIEYFLENSSETVRMGSLSEEIAINFLPDAVAAQLSLMYNDILGNNVSEFQ